MVRSPCCEKTGLKRGPWTPEEDQILVSHIQRHGHANWRVLPMQAGLSRCGKSCRLRWINYLRPDIKRGNFTRDEEDTIISLHHLLGNRWSAIAAKLPGRTDNEIKNVWHTHLKKRTKQSARDDGHQQRQRTTRRKGNNKLMSSAASVGGYSAPAEFAAATLDDQLHPCSTTAHDNHLLLPASAPRSCSEFSYSSTSTTSAVTGESNGNCNAIPQLDDDNFWLETVLTLPLEEIDSSAAASMDLMMATPGMEEPGSTCTFFPDAENDDEDHGMDFWLKLLIELGN